MLIVSCNVEFEGRCLKIWGYIYKDKPIYLSIYIFLIFFEICP